MIVRKVKNEVSLLAATQSVFPNGWLYTLIVSETDPRKIRKRVWEIGWGGSVPCTRNAGALLIGS